MTGLGRDTAKTANFAKGYGSGVATFAKTIGKSLAEAAAIMAQYDARLPFVSKLFRIEQEKAARTGITRLYDGALRHWNLYAPPWQDKERLLVRRGKAPRHRSGASLVRPDVSVAPGRARHLTRWFRAWARGTPNSGCGPVFRGGHHPAAADARRSGMLGRLARAGRDDRAARRRGGLAQRADEGRPQVRQDLGRRHAQLGRADRRKRAKHSRHPDRSPKPAPVNSAQAGDRHSTQAHDRPFRCRHQRLQFHPSPRSPSR